MPGFFLRTFLRDRRGVVSVLGALHMALAIIIAAIAIDAGSLFLARRNLQATSDAAALAAVQNPTTASATAASIFAQNGYDSPSLTVTSGIYTADEALDADGRFVSSGPASANAVRVLAAVNQQTFFAPLFGLSSLTNISAQATAARVPTTSFGAGTRLAQLNAGVINNVLGKLWNSSLSLTLLDYQALLDSDINIMTFLDALAVSANVSSYDQLASASVTSGQFFDALVETASTSGAITGSPAAALLALKALQGQVTAGTTLIVGNVIDLSSLAGRTIGNVAEIDGQGLQTNLMGLVSAGARTVGGGKTFDLGSAFTIPIVNTSISARLAVGNKMAQVSAAKVGATVHTAQMRLELKLTIAQVNLGLGPLLALQVPLYLEGASGDATLTAMPCIPGGTLSTITASSGASGLQFADVSAVGNAQLANFSQNVTLSPANVVTLPLGLGVVRLSGSTSMVSAGPTALNFTQAEIDAGTVKTVSGNAIPFASLASGYSVSIPLVSGLVSAAVTPVLNVLDAQVNSLLTALGLQLGSVDVRVFDSSCRTPTLVG